ncbi:coilin isoform X2 [Drosophila obscura]|uniref:coilin isoform X2 n=1 Tax=Drosophila obscura TaxID=7282 RepID=UPI001BB13E51|nr:coilin isoform X2 [Drosophila obscura]
MESFTMKVNLTNFFSDERQHALILIDSAWKNIKDVQQHIQILFNLKDIRLLTNSGYFLPPMESLRVLKDAGGLKAFTFNEPPPASVEGGCKKTGNKRKKSFVETESSHHSPPLDQPKRSKHRNKSTLQVITLNGTNDDKVTPVLGNSLVACNNTTEAEAPLSNSTLNASKRFKQRDKSTLLQIPPNSANETQRPMPQYSPELDNSNSNDDDNSKTEPPVESLSKTGNILGSEHQISRSSLQIVLGPTQPSESQEPKSRAKENISTLLVPEPTPIAFRCPLMELDSNKVRTYKISFKAKSAQDIPRKLQEKQTDSDEHIQLATSKAATQEPALLGDPSENTTIVDAGAETETEAVAPSVDVKMVPRRVCAETINCDSEDDVMVLDDTNVDVDSDVEVSQVVTNCQTNDSMMEIFENASPLKDLPKRGDTILFKLRKIKGSMGSGLTGVITASCTYINRRTKAVSMEVKSSPAGISHVLSQYSNSLDDSCEEMPSLMVNMSDLIEAKRPK